MASLLCFSKALTILPREPSVKFQQGQPCLFSLSDNRPFFSCFPIPIVSTPKPKVVFVLGSSGTGKSKLAIDLALSFGGEVINSDKMQVYDGLRVITNKVTTEECAGIPHHLLGGVRPDADFTAVEFRHLVTILTSDIVARGRLPIIAGGSNSYIKELVTGESGAFSRQFDCCFIWVDVDQAVLKEFVAERVDKMVEQGLVEEARGVFDPAADYSKGVRRSIGVPEMDGYFRREGEADETERSAMLDEAFREIKENTCRLTQVQREKIRRFEVEDGWGLHRVDATAAVLWRNEVAGGRVWKETVVAPSVETVRRFFGGAAGFVSRCGGAIAAGGETALVAAVAGATK